MEIMRSRAIWSILAMGACRAGAGAFSDEIITIDRSNKIQKKMMKRVILQASNPESEKTRRVAESRAPR